MVKILSAGLGLLMTLLSGSFSTHPLTSQIIDQDMGLSGRFREAVTPAASQDPAHRFPMIYHVAG